MPAKADEVRGVQEDISEITIDEKSYQKDVKKNPLGAGGSLGAMGGREEKRKREKKGVRQRPTFPHPRGCSIMGPGGLNGRVRDGNGWNPSGMATGQRKVRLNKDDDGFKPLDRLVLVHYNPCRSCMPSLSTW